MQGLSDIKKDVKKDLELHIIHNSRMATKSQSSEVWPVEEVILYPSIENIKEEDDSFSSCEKGNHQESELQNSDGVINDLFCRICGNYDNGTFHLIFSPEGEKLHILEKITYCLPIMIMESDELSHSVCGSCIEKLTVSFELITTAIKTEKRLRSVCSDAKWWKINDSHFLQQLCFVNDEANISSSSVITTENQVEPVQKSNYTVVNSLNYFQSTCFKICDICNKEFGDTDQLYKHVQEDHIPSREAKHELSEKNSAVLEIVIDDESDDENKKLVNVISTVNREEKPIKLYTCGTCKKVYMTKSTMNKHQCMKVRKRYFKCNECGKVFTHVGLYHSHKMLHFSERMICLICNKAFTNKFIFEKHKQAHSQELVMKETDITEAGNGEPGKTHQCDICGRTYKYINNLARHYKLCLLRSRSIPTHHCRFCPASFTVKWDLIRHTRSIHIVREKIKQEWVCRYCGKHLATRYGLEDHERIHTKEKPFVCEHCGRAFVSYASLQQHSVTHTGVRKHACSVCNKRFQRKSHVRLHMRTHTGERPFVCDICGRSFTQVGDMRRHRNRHSFQSD